MKQKDTDFRTTLIKVESDSKQFHQNVPLDI